MLLPNGPYEIGRCSDLSRAWRRTPVRAVCRPSSSALYEISRALADGLQGQRRAPSEASWRRLVAGFNGAAQRAEARVAVDDGRS